MFVPHKTPTGAVPPWEYYPAAAGSYKAGQLVELADGKINAFAEVKGVMPYICMADIEVEEDGIVPVIHADHETIYRSELAADAADAVIGTFGEITDGLTVTAEGTGAFEITWLEGTTAGSAVYGRLHY